MSHTKGDQLPVHEHVVSQEDVLRYAGASGDYNRLHWDGDFAAEVSPTGEPIAHGMLTLGLLANLVAEWAGGPEHVLSLSASFRAPLPVGATVRVGGEVVDVDRQGGLTTVAIWAETGEGEKVIDRRKSRAVIATR